MTTKKKKSSPQKASKNKIGHDERLSSSRDEEHEKLKDIKSKEDGEKKRSVGQKARVRHEKEEKPEDRFDTRNKPQFRAGTTTKGISKQGSSSLSLSKSSNNTKVVLDDRFASLLTDPRFQLDIRDRYGRRESKKDKSKKNSSRKEQLSAFYTIQQNETPSESKDKSLESENETQFASKTAKSKHHSKERQGSSLTRKNDADDHDDDCDDDNDDGGGATSSEDDKDKGDSDSNPNDSKSESDGKDFPDPASRIAYLTALSRGELDVSSSSSDDDEQEEDDEASSGDDEDDDEDGGGQEKVGILDPSYAAQHDPVNQEQEPVLTMEPSRYLAVLNLDWSHVRAVDIYAIVASFVPPGAVENVQVFPSDFGMEQMAKENELGPSSNLWKKKKKASKDQQQQQQQQHLKATTTGTHSDGEESNDYESDEEGDGDGKSGRKLEKVNKESSKRSDEDENEGSNDEDEDSHDEEDSNVDDDDDIDEHDDYPLDKFLANNALDQQDVESDFDPEKLRAFEASRLKYYFAVVCFNSEAHADVAYREVDGMELEHSSAAMDVRAIPPMELSSVVQSRPLRDEASEIPSNYVPPDFVVQALQQTKVKCTWEAGDVDRDRVLTKYTSSGRDWKALSESDDLKAYLASDVSSDENDGGKDDDDDDDSDHDGKRDHKKGSNTNKASLIRKMLGLDTGDEKEENEKEESTAGKSNKDQDQFLINDDEIDSDQSSPNDFERAASQSDGDDDDDDEEDGKEVRYIPGSKELADKIRSKMSSSSKQLTPWEKYQERRREKKKEKKKEAQAKREEVKRLRRGDSKATNSKQRTNSDSLFLDDREGQSSDQDDKATKSSRSKVIRTEELELLVAGDDADEAERDYDMRGLQRLEKNKDKKLRGLRKRKEDKLTAGVTGTDFQMDLADDRFKAVLDGQDDRFGIDRTNPQFQDTPAMRQVLAEQQNRRRKRRQPPPSAAPPAQPQTEVERQSKRSKTNSKKDHDSNANDSNDAKSSTEGKTQTVPLATDDAPEKPSLSTTTAVAPNATPPKTNELERKKKKRKKKKEKKPSKTLETTIDDEDASPESSSLSSSGAKALSALMSQLQSKVQ
ncbi:hypothetical protein ACA910_020228 [Epithemia clementina (nom. ined.)]